VREQLTAVTDLATWRLLRRELGLSPGQTTAAIRELVDACLPSRTTAAVSDDEGDQHSG
jgi:hypothetical protein